MPDFNIVIMAQCGQMDEHTKQVGKYVVSGLFDERTWPTCTCAGYKFAPRTISFGGVLVPAPCKHIRQAEAEACSYHELVDGPPKQKDVCPRCGGRLTYVSVAV